MNTLKKYDKLIDKIDREQNNLRLLDKELMLVLDNSFTTKNSVNELRNLKSKIYHEMVGKFGKLITHAYLKTREKI